MAAFLKRFHVIQSGLEYIDFWLPNCYHLFREQMLFLSFKLQILF